MRSKAPLVLMEQLLMLLVFALAAAVCVRTFILSDSLSKQSEQRDCALIEAQTAAEYAKADKVSDYLTTYNGAYNGKNGFLVGFDQDWNSVRLLQADGESENEEITYLLSYEGDDSTQTPYLWTAEIVVTDMDGEELCRLPVAGQNVGVSVNG